MAFNGKLLLRLLIWAITYFFAAKLGLALVIQPEGLASIWPASGVALAALLLSQKREWPAILSVIFTVNAASNLLSGNSVLVSLGFAFSNSLEPFVCGWVITRFAGWPITFYRVKDAIGLALVAIIVNAFTAMIGALVPTLGFGSDYWLVWRVWWSADGLGIFIVTPFIVIWANERPAWNSISLNRYAEMFTLACSLLIIGLIVFSFPVTEVYFINRPSILFPILIWSAFRFRVRGAVTSSLLISIVAITITVLDFRFYISENETIVEKLLSNQISLSILSITAFILAIVINNHKLAEEIIREKETNLKLFLDNAQDLIYRYRLEPSMEFEYVSPSATAITGYTPEEHYADPNLGFKLIHPDDQHLLESVRQITTQPNLIILRWIKKDGSVIWTEQHNRYLKDEFGKVIAIEGIARDITDRKLAENEIKKSEEKYRTLVELLQEGIWVIDQNANTTFVNPFMAEMLGYNAQEMQGRHLFSFMDEHGIKIAQNNLERRQQGIKELHEFEFLMKDGQRIFTMLKTAPILDDNGVYTGAIASVTDITERKLMEDALRQNERLLALITDNVPALITYIDKNERYLYVNKAYYDWFGLKKEDIIGKKINDILPPESYKIVKENINSVLKGERVAFENIIPNKSNITRIVQATYVPYFDDNGHVQSFVGMIQDITDQKRAEEALRESTERFRALFEGAPDAIFLANPETGTIIDANDSACRLAARSREELIGLDQFELHPPDRKSLSISLFSQHVQQSSKEGFTHPISSIILTADGKHIPVEIIAQMIQVKGQNILMGIFRDITERKKAETALLAAKEMAEAANKTKSEFLATISHEIRTPLNAILGFAELLDDMMTDPRKHGYIKAIQVSGDTLLKLINDILDISKIEAGKMKIQPTPVKIRQLLEDVQQLFILPASQKNLDILLEIDPQLPEAIMLDEVRLRQVLFNLVGNGLKFTEMGFVKITATQLEKKDHLVDLKFMIEDTGIGIPQSEQQVIFDAFQQRPEQKLKQFGGTGLGLAISKRLVEMMGGTIQLRSVEGKGSTFEIIFSDIPVTHLDLVANEAEPTIIDLSGLQATVLVVDDVESNRHLLTFNLEYTGITVLEASNGEEALKMARKHKCDLILMDLIMPVMDGHQALQQFKKDPGLKHIPIIAISAFSREQSTDLTGFSGYLVKPISRVLLYREISRVLGFKQLAVQKPSPLTENLEVSSESLKNLPQLLDILEQQFVPCWDQFQKIQPIKAVKQFGMNLKELGEQYHLKLLTDYGENLVTSIEYFDVHAMRQILFDFPQIIKKLKLALK